ncbi:AMP-binding protein [Neobacillus sp. 114]|uniref:AMP-binding protein n=1 Tax=Neobacillus sp. 114 TaxID=3048535 RepID=UPI001C221BEF|nr:AMP-binding protein [Neobacillus sp. 114]MBU8918851.1 AMP-binding protein [Bacillus sp. FJAT-29953]
MHSPKTFNELLGRIQTYPGNKLCSVIDDIEYKYENLVSQVNGLSKYLQEIGIKKGDRVAVWLPNCFEWVVSLLAVGSIGAILVPLNTRFQDTEAKYVLGHSKSKVLITRAKFLNNSYLDKIISWNSTNDPFTYDSRELPFLKNLIWIGEEAPNIGESWKSAVTNDGIYEKVESSDYDPVLIQYTSGTTSFPKGALLTHCGLLQNAYYVGARMNITSEDKVFSAGPFCHIGGVTMQVLLALIYQVPFFSQAYFVPEQAAAMVKKYKCTTYSGIDSLFLLVMELSSFQKDDFSSIRTGWTTGSPEITKLIKEKMGIEDILCIYGLSEASPNVGICDINDPIEKRLNSCGRAHPSCEIRIMDPSTFEFLPPGKEGEIVLKGYNLMLEYFENKEETEKVFYNGWLRTGDLGRMDEDGYLYFLGRIKEIIRVGGENFSPQEVEGLLYEHPNIEQVALIGIPDDKYGEIPVALVKQKAGTLLSLEVIQLFLKGRVASYKIPKKLIIVDQFPMTESGKIQKAKLKDELLNVSR